MNIDRTSGKGGSREAALGPGRGRGGFPRIFPFSMAGADVPAFLGFLDGAFGFTPIPVSVPIDIAGLSPLAPAGLSYQAGLSPFRLGAAGGSVNRSWVNAGMARSGSSAARTSSSE